MLAKQNRAGELASLWVPDVVCNGMRELARTTSIWVPGKARQFMLQDCFDTLDGDEAGVERLTERIADEFPRWLLSAVVATVQAMTGPASALKRWRRDPSPNALARTRGRETKNCPDQDRCPRLGAERAGKPSFHVMSGSGQRSPSGPRQRRNEATVMREPTRTCSLA